MTKNVLGYVAMGLLGLAIGYGLFGNREVIYQVTGGAVSPVNTSNTSAKIATITMAPATAAASTTSIYNSGTDRAITSVFAACTGVGTSKTYLTGAGLAALTVQMSTSTASADAKTNTNYAGNLTIATSSPWFIQASTTPSVLGSVSSIWPSATYLNITFNATNTAACTTGVGYLSL